MTTTSLDNNSLPQKKYQDVTIDQDGNVEIPDIYRYVFFLLPCNVYIGHSFQNKYVFVIPAMYFDSIQSPPLLLSPLIEAEYDIIEHDNNHTGDHEYGMDLLRAYNRFIKEKVCGTVNAAGKIQLPTKMLNRVGLMGDVICLERTHHVELWDKEQWERDHKHFPLEFDKFEQECFEKGLL